MLEMCVDSFFSHPAGSVAMFLLGIGKSAAILEYCATYSLPKMRFAVPRTNS